MMLKSKVCLGFENLKEEKDQTLFFILKNKKTEMIRVKIDCFSFFLFENVLKNERIGRPKLKTK